MDTGIQVQWVTCGRVFPSEAAARDYSQRMARTEALANWLYANTVAYRSDSVEIATKLLEHWNEIINIVERPE